VAHYGALFNGLLSSLTLTVHWLSAVHQLRKVNFLKLGGIQLPYLGVSGLLYPGVDEIPVSNLEKRHKVNLTRQNQSSKKTVDSSLVMVSL
jgi:hypothetical protein